MPQAIASAATMPKVSNRDGMATTRAEASSRSFSSPSTRPTKRTRPATPEPLGGPPHGREVGTVARDDEVARQPVGGERPGLEQQVEALLGGLHAAEEHDVAPAGLPGGERRRAARRWG